MQEANRQHQAEDSIKAGLEAKGLKVESVTCPTGKSAKKGDNFDCIGKAGGKDFTVSVEQTDDNGAVKWTLEGFLVDSKAIVAKVSPGLPAGTTLHCADKPTTVERGGYKLDCELENPDSKVQIVFADDGAKPKPDDETEHE